jgi:hypothetical protein
MIVARCVLVAVLVFGFFAAEARPATAQGTQFSLAVGQSTAVGPYTIVFRGIVQRMPAYDLYVGSTLAAQFPSPGSSPDPGAYRSADGRVAIATTSIAPDGSAVTGTVTVR